MSELKDLITELTGKDLQLALKETEMKRKTVLHFTSWPLLLSVVVVAAAAVFFFNFFFKFPQLGLRYSGRQEITLPISSSKNLL